MDVFKHGELDEFVPWHDEEGEIINASDGGMIYVDGIYHWYGLALRPLPFAGDGKGGQTTTTGVVMYASKDLYHWRYEMCIRDSLHSSVRRHVKHYQQEDLR